MTKEEARPYIKEAVSIESFVSNFVDVPEKRNHNGSFQCDCPLCGSGTGPKRTGAFTIYPDTKSFSCYSCHSSGDIFDLYAKMYHLDLKQDFPKILEGLAPYAGITIDEQSEPNKVAEIKAVTRNNTRVDGHKNYTKFISFCRSHAGETDYFKKRGFSDKVVKGCNLGYTPNFKFMTNKGVKEEPAIIIPYNKENTYYFARSTVSDLRFKPSRQTAGPEPVWNASALGNKSPCFVCESPIDALSVIQSGQPAIAVGGTGVSKLLEALDKYSPELPLVLAFDNDVPGQSASDTLKLKLEEKGIKCVTAKWSLDKYPEGVDIKDPNAMLQADPKLFKTDVQKNSELAIKTVSIVPKIEANKEKSKAMNRSKSTKKQPVKKQPAKDTISKD